MKIQIFGYTIIAEKTRLPETKKSRQDYHKQGIWVTAAGEKIHVSKMDFEHLMNVWMLMKRRVDEFCQLYGDAAPSRILEQIIIFPFLCEEIEKRVTPEQDLFLDEMPH